MPKRQNPLRSFRPQLFSLEERAVPAAYYVDNAFVGKANGTVVTFNAGQSNQVAGLVVGTNAFATIPQAVTKANADAAADTINIANGTFNLDPNTTSTLLITNPASLVGSGLGQTFLKATSSTASPSGTTGALFAAQGVAFNVRDLELDGNSPTAKVASGFRYESGATGTVSNVTIRNLQFAGIGASVGYGIVAVGTGTNVTVDDSNLINNGRGGVRIDAGANATVTGSTFTGRSGSTDEDINYGVDVSGASQALISGNTITGFSAVSPSFGSAGIFVSSSTGSPSSATILGNTISGNNTGILVGIGGGDASFVNAQFNNIVNNSPTSGAGSAIFVDSTATTTAVNNNFGNATGPQAPDNNNGNTTASVTGGVTYKDAAIVQPPNGIATGTLPTVVSTTPAEAKTAATPTATITGPSPGTAGPITITIAFSDTVNGFTTSDITFNSTAGTPTVKSLTTTDNKTFNLTVSGLNKRGDLVVNIPANSLTSIGGINNNLITQSLPFQPVFDRGFTVSGDAGAVTPLFGVTDTFNTQFGKTVFGSNFTGGQRVATADLNSDGTLDYIVGSGPGITTQVVAIDGASGVQLFSLIPFGNSFTRGAYVSAGDLTGDGLAEIAITAERGGGARIRIFSPDSTGSFNQIADFIGLIGSDGKADTSFRGGARSAIGDINGDGRADLVFAAGTGGGPRIALFDGKTLGTNGGPKLTGDFFVFEPTLRDGSNVSVGDVNGDGKGDLVVGAGNGASRVRVINGNTLITSNGNTVTAIADFFAFGTTGSTGVRVTAKDLDGDGKADVIAGPGSNSGSTVRVYPSNFLLAAPGNPAFSQQLNLFGAFTGGVFVG